MKEFNKEKGQEPKKIKKVVGNKSKYLADL